MNPMLWVVLGLLAAIAVTRHVSPGAFRRRSPKERAR